MAYDKRKPRHDWRAKLTADERREVTKLESAINGLSAERAGLVARLGPIRNRAIQRARYEGTTPATKETTN